MKPDIGIDIGTAVRPGGVPVHVVNSAAPVRPNPNPPGQLFPGLPAGGVRTFDPFAFVGRARKALGRKMSG